MENQQENQDNASAGADNNQNNTNSGQPTNPNIESHKQKEEDGYKISIEDTMIGYDGHEDQMDVDLGNGNANTNNTRGVDDND